MSKLVPRYWAEGRLRHRQDGRQLTLRRWGWSDESPAQAQALADARVRAAMDQALQNWPAAPHKFPLSLLRREPKRAYNGAEGVPIREEIVEERGQDVITRNSYGARCLNTPDVFIADIDTADLKRITRPWCVVAALGAMGTGAAWWWWLWMQPGPAQCLHPCPSDAAIWWQLAWRMLASLLLWLWLCAGLQAKFVDWRGGAVGHARRRLRREPGAWSLYETPAGARILALHDLFDPRSPDTQALMQRLGTDRLYRLMSRNQGCFRARVSAKPWRLPAVERLRGPVWPILDPEKLTLRKRWIENYELSQAGFAACRFRYRLGADAANARAEEVQQWHDSLSQAQTGKPLA